MKSSRKSVVLTQLSILLIYTLLLSADAKASKISKLSTVPVVPSVEHSAAYQSREPPRSVNEALR